MSEEGTRENPRENIHVVKKAKHEGHRATQILDLNEGQ